MDKIHKNWTKLLKEYQVGSFIEGLVLKHENFGFFLDLNIPPVLGLVRITSINDNSNYSMTLEDFPKIGQKVKGIITDFNENNQQVNISLKKSDFKKFGQNIEF